MRTCTVPRARATRGGDALTHVMPPQTRAQAAALGAAGPAPTIRRRRSSALPPGPPPMLLPHQTLRGLARTPIFSPARAQSPATTTVTPTDRHCFQATTSCACHSLTQPWPRRVTNPMKMVRTLYCCATTQRGPHDPRTPSHIALGTKDGAVRELLGSGVRGEVPTGGVCSCFARTGQ